jgi:HEAT repeat protein
MTAKMDQVLEVLRNPDAPLTAKMLYNLTDLEGADKEQLYLEWGTIPLDRRRKLMHRLAEVAETNFEMDFSAVTRLAMTDLDSELREAAVDASWTDESPDMLRRLMPLASIDISPNVRAAAVAALGRFIELGEDNKFDKQMARQAENLAIKIYNNHSLDIDIRRRALEAISNCSRSEVPAMIEEAYKQHDTRMRASALYAMGRTCDERWSSTVLRELKNTDAMLRYEATRAAGELSLEQAVPLLGKMLGEADREVQEMAIWSLGEIGGGDAQRFLRELSEQAEKDGDDELVEAIEEALAAASLAGGDLAF